MFLAGLTLQPAEAGDRKSAAGRDRSALSDMIASREAYAKPMRPDGPGTSADRAAASSAVLDRPSGNREWNANCTAA